MPGKTKKITFLKRVWLPIILCVFIGFAPFGEEPHLLGKIKWIHGGAVGMEAMDWFDFFFHLSPFIYLLLSIFPFKRGKA